MPYPKSQRLPLLGLANTCSPLSSLFVVQNVNLGLYLRSDIVETDLTDVGLPD